MARKAGQLISCGSRTWLVHIFLGRDPELTVRGQQGTTFSNASITVNSNVMCDRVPVGE